MKTKFEGSYGILRPWHCAKTCLKNILSHSPGYLRPKRYFDFRGTLSVVMRDHQYPCFLSFLSCAVDILYSWGNWSSLLSANSRPTGERYYGSAVKGCFVHKTQNLQEVSAVFGRWTWRTIWRMIIQFLCICIVGPVTTNISASMIEKYLIVF